MQQKTFVVLIFSFVSVAVCEHLIVGDVSGKRLIHHSVPQYNAIMLTKRVKYFFYSDSQQNVINSIIAYDNLHSKATANITAGGIGYTYVNIRMKSERGVGLDYDIGIYT